MVALKSSVMSLGELFGSKRLFYIPNFQRRYSWDGKYVARLLAELWQRIEDNKTNDAPLEEHFFGSAVMLDPSARDEDMTRVGRTDGRPASGIVDGQQRLVTFTILWCMLRDRLAKTDAWVADLLAVPDGKPMSCKLEALGTDGLFLAASVFPEGATMLPPIDSASHEELAQSRAALIKDLSVRTPKEMAELARHLRDNCKLVVTSTDSIDLAVDIYSKINARGLKLNPGEVLKAEILGDVLPSAAARLTKLWDDKHLLLGDCFDRLPSHLQAIRGTKSQAIIRDMRRLIRAEGGAEAFFDTTFAPAADMLHLIMSASFSGSPHSARINAAMRFLDLLPGTDWVPPVLAYSLAYAHQPVKHVSFVARFERLAYGLALRGLHHQRRQGHFRDVVRQMHETEGRIEAMPALELDITAQREIVERLDEDVYSSNPQVCKAVLLKLSGALDQQSLSPSLPLKSISVEHILPTNPPAGSNWLDRFRDPAERETLATKLGNLVLLTVVDNKEAGNLEYEAKRDIYFRNGAPSLFATTNEVWSTQVWNPDAVRERHDRLIRTMKRILSIDPSL